MNEAIDLNDIKKYVEGPNRANKCTVNVPKSLSIMLDLFVTEIIEQIGKDPSEITTKDVIDVIETTPEYKFLQPLVKTVDVDE